MQSQRAANRAPGGIDLTPADLGRLGDQFARGTEAELFALPGLVLPETAGPLVYKRYRVRQGVRPGLTALTTARNTLDPARRARLDAVTAWPLRRVVDSGTVRGVVLPLVPDTYHHHITMPQSGAAVRQVRDLQWLLVPEHKLRAAGVSPVDGTTRMRLARAAAGAMAFLHDDMDVVLGDVSPRNTLVDVDGPGMMFVDCDAMRLATGPRDRPQLHTDDWDPPGRPTASRETDLYKLGLLVLRVLVPRHQASQDRDPSAVAGVLDDRGRDMIRRAVDPHGSPAARPEAREWFVVLSHLLGEPVAPPELTGVTREPGVVVPGAATSVRWTLSAPARVRVFSGGSEVAFVDATAGDGGADAVPRCSGVLTVFADNALGTDSAGVPPVIVLTPPSTRDQPVPLPRIDLPPITEPARHPAFTPPDLPFDVVAPTALPPLPAPWPPGGVPPPAPPAWFNLPPLPDLDPDRAPLDLLAPLTATPDLDRRLPRRERARR